jgi:DNA-directed RNA polymerase specialized sigma24 family protein/CheY-like chemotaxis protein
MSESIGAIPTPTSKEQPTMNALAREISSILPILRSYACAVTGSRRSGDRYLEVCLEVVLRDPARFRSGDDTRLQFYKLFSEVIRVFGSFLADGVSSPHRDHPLGRSILELPLPQRQLILLSHLANFTHDQIAVILDMPPSDVAAGIALAREKIMPQVSARILVLEDEPVTAIDIAEIVYQAGHALFGVAASRADALRLARKGRPDLILADVTLGRDSSGITIAQEIAGNSRIPIVYIARNGKSVPEDRTRPRFIIPKPFTADVVTETINEALGGRALSFGATMSALPI